MSALAYIVARLKEPSTWAGASALALSFGVAAPEWAIISQIGAGIFGTVAVFLPGA